MARDLSQLDGTKLNNWTLIKSIGKGADGIVYSATNDDGKAAAIKLFLHESLKNNGFSEARERLELQLALVGKKHHPNIVEIYEGGEAPELETLYLAMELVPGKSLDKLLGQVPSDRIPLLLQQLAEAARYLEEEFELYHRDIKPANIVISDDLSLLTLLDLGIVYRIPDEQAGRLSGAEFVATLRYSPPEFVWRNEESSEDGAWRAITLYQIGATLHDMLAGKLLFAGEDTPRARLYDCVRDKTPTVPNLGGDLSWLTPLAQCCLLKDWRQRLQFVTWKSFSGPPDESSISTKERSIKLKQAQREETRLAQARSPQKTVENTREQALWELNAGVFGEIRTYLLDSNIFPKFKVDESKNQNNEYVSQFIFDADESKGCPEKWQAQIIIAKSSISTSATDLTVQITCGKEVLAEAKWTEMFTIDNAVSNCQRTLLDAVDKLLA
jgi:serine/threonine protein kinase